jgi:hypothetical protein
MRILEGLTSYSPVSTAQDSVTTGAGEMYRIVSLVSLVRMPYTVKKLGPELCMYLTYLLHAAEFFLRS